MSEANRLAANADARQLWRFIGLYGASEMAQRVTRIVTTILLARMLLPDAFGVAAIAITTFELVRVVANCGIGQAVIRASDADVASAAEAAWRLLWPLMSILMIVQVAIGYVLALVSGRDELVWMLFVLGGVYLMMPFGLIQTYLTQRANRHGAVASIATVQALTDNILTAVFALFDLGAWAIILPKVITTPIWVFGMRYCHHWERDASVTPLPTREMLSFALPVIGSELVATARLQLDKVIVGAVLGIEALGVYYFVFNAGLGLSLSITGALAASVYPYLAEAARQPRELKRRFETSLGRTAWPVCMIIAVQAALTTLYVPIMFGERWAHVAVLVQLLCLSALAKPLADVSGQMLRAAGLQTFDFAASTGTMLLCLGAFALALPMGLTKGIMVLAATTVALQLLYAAVAYKMLANLAEGVEPTAVAGSQP